MRWMKDISNEGPSDYERVRLDSRIETIRRTIALDLEDSLLQYLEYTQTMDVGSRFPFVRTALLELDCLRLERRDHSMTSE